jgi:hypothetical protein
MWQPNPSLYEPRFSSRDENGREKGRNGYGEIDLMNPTAITQWEKDLIEATILTTLEPEDQ